MEDTALFCEFHETIERFRPDLVIIDPLVELHDIPENDNTGIRIVGAKIRELARSALDDREIAILLLHHTRKGNPDPGNPDVDQKGGGSGRTGPANTR